MQQQQQQQLTLQRTKSSSCLSSIQLLTSLSVGYCHSDVPETDQLPAVPVCIISDTEHLLTLAFSLCDRFFLLFLRLSFGLELCPSSSSAPLSFCLYVSKGDKVITNKTGYVKCTTIFGAKCDNISFFSELIYSQISIIILKH